jgi:hypothetical protein
LLVSLVSSTGSTKEAETKKIERLIGLRGAIVVDINLLEESL